VTSSGGEGGGAGFHLDQMEPIGAAVTLPWSSLTLPITNTFSGEKPPVRDFTKTFPIGIN
jgi:hypothetical protein